MWQYNQTINSDELYHYGVPGMKWGHRRAIKKAAINRYRNEYNKKQIGKSAFSRAYSKITGADKIYAQTRYNLSKIKSKSSKSKVVNEKTKNKTANSNSTINRKKSMKTGKKKVANIVSKKGNTPIKSTAKTAKIGLSAIQSLYNISDTAKQNRQMTSYVNTASQMSPEYRRRFMYN